ALTDYALKRTALLIQEIAGGTIAMDVVDTNSKPIDAWTVDFDFERCNKLIGHDISKDMVKDILINLDIKIIEENGSLAKLSIPTYRVDVTREADVVEEVLRIYGFNKVPIPEKLNSSISYFPKPDIEKVQTVVSEMLVGLGYTETLNNSLTKSEYVVKLAGEVLSNDNSVKMLNPLSQDLDVMRQSMIFNALEMVAHNQNRQNSDLKLYEFGKTYFKYDSGYSENKRLMILVTGKKERENWNSSKDENSFFTIKGLAITVLKRLGLEGMLKEKALKKSLLQDGSQLFVLKNKVGEIGWASSKMKKHFGIKKDVFIADLDWDAILDALKFSKIKSTELPKTFAVRRDFSLLLDSQVAFSEIENIAKTCDKKILKEIGLFDVYEGKNLPEGKKSYAVSFKFQDAEKTLKDQQVDAVMNKIRVQLEEKLGAELR
ncbi:MAG: phenylalanine--tRNA ligase subunit beta, partial [Methylococcales bacterium]|nr:phenylalanine--tRNA ligase subunit beta [Methylococcales bacterium]